MKVADLCELYLKIGIETKKPMTVLGNLGRINRHIKPLIGTKSVSEVTVAEAIRNILRSTMLPTPASSSSPYDPSEPTDERHFRHFSMLAQLSTHNRIALGRAAMLSYITH
jgi:hypothetical protein